MSGKNKMKRKYINVLLALLLALSLSLVTAAPAAAATINVPGDHGTIQAAIDAADPGDIITVDAGTYTEDLTIDESVTLQGEGSENTTIVGAHTITVSNVSLDEFELDCDGTVGVTVDSSASAISGTSITNCVFEMSHVAFMKC